MMQVSDDWTCALYNIVCQLRQSVSEHDDTQVLLAIQKPCCIGRYRSFLVPTTAHYSLGAQHWAYLQLTDRLLFVTISI